MNSDSTTTLQCIADIYFQSCSLSNQSENGMKRFDVLEPKWSLMQKIKYGFWLRNHTVISHRGYHFQSYLLKFKRKRYEKVWRTSSQVVLNAENRKWILTPQPRNNFTLQCIADIYFQSYSLSNQRENGTKRFDVLEAKWSMVRPCWGLTLMN